MTWQCILTALGVLLVAAIVLAILTIAWLLAREWNQFGRIL